MSQRSLCVACGQPIHRTSGELCYPLCARCETIARREAGQDDEQIAAAVNPGSAAR